MHLCNIGKPIKFIAIDIARPFSETKRGTWYFLITMDYFTNLLEVYVIPNQEALIVGHSCDQLPVTLWSWGICMATKAGTRSHDFYGRYYGIWKFVRCALHLCIHSQMVWWHDTWRQQGSTWGRSFWCTRGVGTGGYPLPAEQQSVILWDHIHGTAFVVFGRERCLPFDLLSPPPHCWRWYFLLGLPWGYITRIRGCLGGSSVEWSEVKWSEVT
jgi:hypothetical protein